MQAGNIQNAIAQMAETKGIPKEIIIDAIEYGLAGAYKRDFGSRDQSVEVKLNHDLDISNPKIYRLYEVVPRIIDPKDMPKEAGAPKIPPMAQQITPEDAKKLDHDAKIGQTVKEELNPPMDYGRIAAQTAKQIIMQKLRESESKLLEDYYADKVGQVVVWQIQRIEGNNVIVDLDKATATLTKRDQIPGEKYNFGTRMKFYVVKLARTSKGLSIIISRTHSKLIEKLLEQEVPEILDGQIEIMKVAREPGIRSKVAVLPKDEEMDSVGACVGQSGLRIQNIINELNGEFIDVIEWSEDPVKIIERALAPAQLHAIRADEEKKRAKIYLEEDERSLAIGKKGQNVRLASMLAGWEIDVLNMDAFYKYQGNETQSVTPNEHKEDPQEPSEKTEERKTSK